MDEICNNLNDKVIDDNKAKITLSQKNIILNAHPLIYELKDISKTVKNDESVEKIMKNYNKNNKLETLKLLSLL